MELSYQKFGQMCFAMKYEGMGVDGVNLRLLKSSRRPWSSRNGRRSAIEVAMGKYLALPSTRISAWK